jgi:hypothetical protein
MTNIAGRLSPTLSGHGAPLVNRGVPTVASAAPARPRAESCAKVSGRPPEIPEAINPTVAAGSELARDNDRGGRR